jgi:O-6-methylguanine DNA methyltransferase
MYCKTNYTSRLGDILLASDGENLIGLWFESQKYYGGDIKDKMTQNNDLPVFTSTKAWLDRYFGGEKPDISGLPFAPRGGKFRQSVWDILCEIPYGECITYGDIARELAAKSGKASMSAQAVGGAVGHNPISIIIPCHRVVGSGGSLTGYAGGIDKKIELLKLEGVDVSRFHIPK